MGVSGRKELRSSEKTSSGATLPALICGMASPSWMVVTSTWLPRTAVRAGLPLSNGTSVPLTSACLNSTVCASWLPVPTPVVPKVMLRPAPVRSLMRLEAGALAGHQHVVVLGQAGDDVEVIDVDGLVRGDRQRGDGDQGGGEQEQVLAVGRLARHFLGGEGAVGAGLVHHGHRGAEGLGGAFGDGAGDQVGAAAGGLAHGQVDGTVGDTWMSRLLPPATLPQAVRARSVTADAAPRTVRREGKCIIGTPR